MSYNDENPNYWRDYSNLQYVKHQLIRNYLNGWLPMLGSWNGRIIYLDTHAGRGTHMTGELGSPLIALRTVLNHTFRERSFGACEIVFLFIERDEDNVKALEKEIDDIGELPPKVKIQIVCDECYETCKNIVDDLREKNQSLAPSFIFVDPYGFKVPCKVLRDLMSFDRVELFMNIIWRELNMAIVQGPNRDGMAQLLDYIFNGDSWRGLIGLEFDDKAHACINLFRKLIGSKWATYVRMLGKNKATRYMLMHLSNHDAGRDLMKDCIWKVCPEGGYFARQNDDPKQEFLILPEPDLAPLKDIIKKWLRNEPMRWSHLEKLIRETMWRISHLNTVVRSLRKEGIIKDRYYEGRFGRKNDPELYIEG